MKKKIGSSLVVGAGISGIRSALDLAEQGYSVILIDKSPNLGGVLAQVDYQFPTDHCGMCKMLPLVERDCSSQFCLRKGLFHENIDIMLSTQLVDLEGEPGKYRVTLKKKATMVNPDLCMGCGECSRICPVEVSDEFNAGLSKRKAIYLPVPHNIPNSYVVDMAACTLCGECERICPTGAIDFGAEVRKQFRILVVDDETAVRTSLKEWLEDEGFSVDMAESGEEALKKLSNGPYQLMLLDIKMPGMDGVEVLNRSRDIYPDIPVVMMTAYATVETAVEAMKIGAMDYLMKPFDPDSLIPLIVKLYRNLEETEERIIEVGAVILSAGFKSWDPAEDKNLYEYGELPNVITSIEFERLLSGTGPSQGKLLRRDDGKDVKKIAWLQCIGSRNSQTNADFCSSACCMFAVKEALLAKEKSGDQVEASIFYMDMRTFGKDFQRYRDRAEKEHGIRFLRSRVHTVEPEGRNGGLKIVYVDTDGSRHEEIFDMVVLAAGQRPASETETLAEMTAVELNPWGFCKTNKFSLTKTSREGILAGGSFSGLRDISESIIQAGSASFAASRLIHSHGGSLAEESRPELQYRDVSREQPRVSVALCRCGGTPGDSVDMDSLAAWVRDQASVSEVNIIDRVCTRKGWEELQETLDKNDSNRVLIGACMPYAYSKRLRDLGESIGLSPSLMDIVDIRSQAFPGNQTGNEQVSRDVETIISMALNRVKGLDPIPVHFTRINQDALIVGGGIAGMTAALGIADHGFNVMLVEKSDQLGGNLRLLHRTVEGDSPQELLETCTTRIEKHPNIRLYMNARILNSTGHVGRFSTVIEKEDGTGETIQHGVAVLATGGQEAQPEEYGYGESDLVLTQLDLERKIESKEIDPANLESVVMIQCVGSRQEPRNYCSRVCCVSALKNALFIKKQNPEANVYILYRDIMAYGFLETYYTQARKTGVLFFHYEVDKKPQVRMEEGRPLISVIDSILGRKVEIKPDLLILSAGIVPNSGKDLADLFGVSVNEDGFFLEAEYKWRPVDFIKEGIFMAGTAHSPRSIAESIAMAEAAVQRVLRIISNERLAAGNITAEVRHSLCSACERCIDACPYGARMKDEEDGIIVVDELMCQGCGSCAAICPNSATVLRGYRDQQLFEVIDAVLDNL